MTKFQSFDHQHIDEVDEDKVKKLLTRLKRRIFVNLGHKCLSRCCLSLNLAMVINNRYFVDGIQ